MNARELLATGSVEWLERDDKLRLLRACGVVMDLEGKVWTAKVDRCGIASPNQDEVIHLALAMLTNRRDLWPTWSPPIVDPPPMDPAA